MRMPVTAADDLVRDAVLRQLAWDPEFNASFIRVSCRHGVVTLTGFVNTYPAKRAAERAARRVPQARGIVSELDVRLADERIDPELAGDAAHVLRNHLGVPSSVTAAVQDGTVTLTGDVDWQYQKLAAERAVQYVRGVRHVVNAIVVRAPRADGKARVRLKVSNGGHRAHLHDRVSG